ncbi:MAG: cation transporter [Asticcacaulis sp.]|nr:cation transporter [Asticcacaulis sp.]
MTDYLRALNLRAWWRDLPPAGRVRLASTLSVVTACVLVVLKSMTLVASGSLAVLASLADSSLDLIASLVTFFAVRYARTPPDKEHPFGHGKAEAFSALFQAGLVFASAALVMQACLADLAHPKPVAQSAWAIAVLLLSIVLTLGLVAAQTAAVRADGSVAIAADRMHYLSDLLTNLIAVAGVAAAAFGFLLFDALAGFVMAALLIWGAVKVLREAADHLMDRALDDGETARIRELALADPRILSLTRLRTRLAGPYIGIQLDVALDPAMTLEAAHRILIATEKRLLEAFPNADIIIHPDPGGKAEPHGGIFGESAMNESAQ